MFKKKSWPSLAAGWAALSLAACGASAAKANPEREAAETAPPPVVSLSDVRATRAAGDISATGMLVYQIESTLSFKTGGVITEIRVDEGDTFEAGAVLARVNLSELAAGVAQADAAVKQAQAQFDRTKALTEKDLLPKARLDDAVAALDQAKATREAVSFNQSTGAITARKAGVVLRRLAEPGQTAAPGAPILQIGETATGFVLRAPVTAAEAARIVAGDAAEVMINGLDSRARTSKVVRIASKSDPATGMFEVDLAAGDMARLKSGMSGTVRLMPKAAEAEEGQALPLVSIPTLALLDARADQGFVYVVDDTLVARRRAVQTLGLEDGRVLIGEGLKQGERVISEGAAYVRDGQTVKVAGQ